MARFSQDKIHFSTPVDPTRLETTIRRVHAEFLDKYPDADGEKLTEEEDDDEITIFE